MRANLRDPLDVQIDEVLAEMMAGRMLLDHAAFDQKDDAGGLLDFLGDMGGPEDSLAFAPGQIADGGDKALARGGVEAG